MSDLGLVVVGVAIATGIVGVVVPVLPGALLAWAAIALSSVQFGGKWTDKTPETTEVFGRNTRANVQGAIDKRDKRSPGDLQTDYAWLCNTVHPLVGTALVFAGPPLIHDTGTHVQRWLADGLVTIDGVDAFDEEAFIERSIPSATGRAVVAALDVLASTLAAAMAVVDDIALTTGAPAIADFEYWRALRPTERNAPCPCGSGKKSKNCRHTWNASAPEIPQTFIVDAD